jgi:hypothetical protein
LIPGLFFFTDLFHWKLEINLQVYLRFELISLMEQHTYPKHNLMVEFQAFAHLNLLPFPAHRLVMLDAKNDFKD